MAYTVHSCSYKAQNSVHKDIEFYYSIAQHFMVYDIAIIKKPAVNVQQSNTSYKYMCDHT